MSYSPIRGIQMIYLVYFTISCGYYDIMVKTMQNRQLKRFIYHAKHQYFTMNNVVLAVAAVIAISWAWSSVQAVQRNYQLQRDVDDKRRDLALTQLQTDTLAYEQRYYKSREYQALEAKRRLGLADAGEKVIVLPPNSAQAKALDKAAATPALTLSSNEPAPPPFQQWMNFLFGGNSHARQ